MTTVLTPATRPGNFERARFTGNAKEYFGIWIVNILLTIVTIGIYSAWAKVRRKRYFMGNTVLMDRAFDYHATGKQIFIGRIIVVAMLVIYNIILNVLPIVGGILSLAFFVALPWFAMRSLRFNARVTSYLNVRFDFVGTLGGSFKAFLLGPLIATLTLGLLAPVASRWAAYYIANNLRFGGKEFSTEPALKSLYKQFLLAALIAIAAVIFVAALAAPILATAPKEVGQVLGPLLIAPALIVFAVAAIFYRIGVRNVVWSAARFDHVHEFKSDVPRFGYFVVLFTNLVVTILTLGLMRPWAAVREARYTLEHTAMRLNGPVGDIVAQVEKAGSAIAAEYVDLEGFDFGF